MRTRNSSLLFLLVASGLALPTTRGAAQPATPEPTTGTPVPAPEVVAPTPALTAEAAPAPTSPEPATAPATPAAEEPHARIDYSDGSFYLRSANDNIVFVPSGRMHIDTYTFGGPGVNDYHRSNGSGLSANLFFRRFVIEFGGIIRRKLFYWVGGNFAPTSTDSVQNSVSTANVYDGFVGYMPNPQTRIYVGQYNAPFTMENVTSSRWMDMMERALVVRTLATPYNKADGLMVWGETHNRSFEYQAGVFGGDGMNRPSVDNAVDGMGRLVVRPLANRSDALRRFHVGVGGRIGGRDPNFVRYNAPNLSTPGGFNFWSTTYNDSSSGSAVKTDILPAGRQAAVGGEFYLPFERWDVRGEVVYVNENRREVADTDRATTVRTGNFHGVGAYGQLSLWLWGTPRINGNPAGTYGVLRLPTGLGTQAPNALQLVARAELIRMQYASNSRGGALPGTISAATDDIRVNAYQLGLNYWATKHVRITAEYSLYHFPGSAATNQAAAPGRLAGTSPNAHVLNEISFRVGLAL